MVSDTARLRLRVLGDVQGVGFRYFVQRQAEAAGLKGWVRNQPDGSVECVVEGPRQQLEQLLERVREGPRGAGVDDVQAEWQEPQGDLPGFQVVL